MTNRTNTINVCSMKTITIKNVPEQLRNEFKAICFRKGSTMSKELLKFVEKVVEKEQRP